jgi:predicted PurR-regulated permease PerM
MTLLQFASLGPALIVVGVLGVIQVACSNVIAPQLMSRSLNLSPLVVLFGVFAGGALWGIVGALVAVPVLTIAAIVCAEQPGWRRVAVVLSADGSLPDLEPEERAPTAAPSRGLAE